MSSYKADFGSMPWESPMQGVRQKVHRVGGQRLRLVEYSKALPPHWCDKGHIGYVLEGTMEVRFQNGETQIYSVGDGIFIPDGPEHKHSGKVLSDTARLVFVENAV